jgi:hypothetical protein
VSAAVLSAVLLAVLAITGTRDLLNIPLSWQKPAIYACNFEQRTCPTPPPARATSAAPSSNASACPSCRVMLLLALPPTAGPGRIGTARRTRAPGWM